MAVPVSFQVNYSGSIQSFDIGCSKAAHQAVDFYHSYVQHKNYQTLKNCFNHMFWAIRVDDENQRNINLQICHACHVLALSVLQNLNVEDQIEVCGIVVEFISWANLQEQLGDIKSEWTMKLLGLI